MPQKKKASPRGKSLAKSTGFIIAQHLWVKILVGMALGILAGLVLSRVAEGDTAIAAAEWFGLPGVLFMGLIQMVIVPLVVCSIILGITDSGSLDFVKRLGLRTVPYFIITTMIAVAIGMALVLTVKPGLYVDQSLAGTVIYAAPERTFADLTIPQRIGNMIPKNLTRAGLENDMLQIIVAAILVGIAVLAIPRPAVQPFIDLCVAGQVVTMRIISWAMAVAPYAVFGMMVNITLRTGVQALFSVGLYMVTVLAGLLCMAAVYALIVRLVARRPLRPFMAGIREVQLLAFSTSSSGATMPFTIQAAEEKLGIRPEVTRFIVPLGATINMDGTALYQAVAALFLCQIFGIDLTFSQMILLMFTTVGASIGTPATPGVGIIVLATILTGIGVPVEGIGLILGVDRILDMCRTTINVTGDLTAAAVMDKILPREKAAQGKVIS